MIIKYPTGLYYTFLGWKSDLKISDERSVYNLTWYISSNNPPTIRDRFIGLPAASLQLLPDKVYSDLPRRQSYGELIFNTSESNNTQTGSAKKQFEEGQVLDFEDIIDIDSHNISSNRSFSYQHNNNIIDVSEYLEDTGDIESEMIELNNEATMKIEELSKQLNDLGSLTYDLEIRIKEIQKSINEINKAINAISVIDDSDDLIPRLEAKKLNLNEELEQSVEEFDNNNELIIEIKDKIRKLSTIVR